MLPLKDTMPQVRLPVVTLALIAAGIAGYFVADEGGLLFVAANVLTLWLLAPNVEDSMGRARFAAFVLAGGAIAAGAQAALDSSRIAEAAAVGIIAAAGGGYLVLFPRGKVFTASIVPFLFGIVELPAVAFLALWCVLQVVVGPSLAFLAALAFGLLLARLLVDPARDRRGLEPRIPAY